MFSIFLWFLCIVCYLGLKRATVLPAPTHIATERERERVGDGWLWRQEAEKRGDVVKYTPAIGSSAWLLSISRRTLSCSISISADSAKLLFCHFCFIFSSSVVDSTARMQVNIWARAERCIEKNAEFIKTSSLYTGAACAAVIEFSLNWLQIQRLKWQALKYEESFDQMSTQSHAALLTEWTQTVMAKKNGRRSNGRNGMSLFVSIIYRT